MANPASGTVTDLVANGFVAFPAGDVFDTGSNGTPATLEYDVSGSTERVFFHITNQMATAINIVVGIGAGDYPPAARAGLGAYASANLAQNAVGCYGPFEGARFIQNATNGGKVKLTLTPASGTLAATVRCLRVPKV